MSQLILIILSVIFAVQAIRAYRLLNSALWLAGVSALVSLIFYLMSATQVAVIELSVGAGLVTILFVFAISIAGSRFLWSCAMRAIFLSCSIAIFL